MGGSCGGGRNYLAKLYTVYVSKKKQNFIPTLEYDFCLFNVSNLIDYPLKIL